MIQNFIKSIDEILIKSTGDVLEKEQQLMVVTNQLLNWVMNRYIRYKETQQRSYYLAQGYQARKKASRTVQFLFGPINYQRTPWEKAGQIIYPIDELFGLQPYQRYSPTVRYEMLRTSRYGSLRHVAEIINAFSLITCSKDTIDQVIHEFGKQVKTYHDYEKEYGTVQKRTVDYLFIEADGVMINGQKKQKKEITHFIIHEGCLASYEVGRSRLKNSHEIIGLNHHYVTEQVTEYLYRNYDLRQTVVVINTDGGKGYGPTLMRKLLPEKPQRVEQFIDPYHLNLKFKERVFVSELMPVFKQALYDYSREKTNRALDTLHSSCETAEQEEHYLKLKAYLNRNWKYIQPYHLRDLPQDIYTLGVIESLHRAFTYRMKKQGRYWSKTGSNGMVQLIAASKNQALKELFLAEWRETFALDERLKKEGVCGLEEATENKAGIKRGRFSLETNNPRIKAYTKYLRGN